MLLDIPVQDITTWNSKPWFHTKGTRDKLIVEDSQSREYYFKTSLEKPDKHYPYEFWSEIIASQLGAMLGLPILDYGVAIREGLIGCMSPSINVGNQQLIEGVQYLQSYNIDFKPELKASRDQYSFQFIEKALEHSGLSFFMRNIIEIIMFDAIIGNQDRHQENWGVVISFSDNIKVKNSADAKVFYQKKLKLAGNNYGYRASETQEYKAYQDMSFENTQIFAPIYDSGSSLCRELQESKVIALLKDNRQFDAYIKRGKSEIRWHKKQISHIDLVRNIIIQADYPYCAVALRNMINRYSESNFRYLMESVDTNIPANFASMKIPSDRKELIIRMVTSRIDLLSSLI